MLQQPKNKIGSAHRLQLLTNPECSERPSTELQVCKSYTPHAYAMERRFLDAAADTSAVKASMRTVNESGISLDIYDDGSARPGTEV